MPRVLISAFVTVLCIQSIVSAQNVRATVEIDIEAKPTAYDPMVFGGFIEHLHRQIYGGIFEPGSPLSDEKGFRIDVMEALKEMKMPIVRWPGGCFASAYHWLDGVGLERTPAFDKAWRVEDPNTFGTDEFIRWCQAIGAEPYICINAGTGTLEEMSDNRRNFGSRVSCHSARMPLPKRYTDSHYPPATTDCQHSDIKYS